MWYIVEYAKGGYERQVVTHFNEVPMYFKTKREAEKKIKELFERDATYLYKVWNTNNCAEGDCYVCLNRDCPMRSDK